MSGPRFADAFDAAGEIIARALSVPVARRPTSTPPGADLGDGMTMVVTLSEDGAPQETGYLIGAARPFEFEHRARLVIAIVGGPEADRASVAGAAAMDAAVAIGADLTLGGRVSFAELTQADTEEQTEDEARGGVAIAASLVITYDAETAMG